MKSLATKQLVRRPMGDLWCANHAPIHGHIVELNQLNELNRLNTFNHVHHLVVKITSYCANGFRNRELFRVPKDSIYGQGRDLEGVKVLRELPKF